MPAASAARSFETAYPEENSDPATMTGPGPKRAEQRFRVARQKPFVKHLRRAGKNPFHRNLALAALPALLLLVYVLFWALAIRGGYYRQQIRGQIDDARILRAELEEQKQRLQSPDAVLGRAVKELGMQPAQQREFARIK